ncbi:spore germination protein GerPC [Paenibacillus yanchengensis]|uniref:Spore germination protein GerPC n=1 Tax=Paenibacillus yanchengensis TaxID=2035833 RepID=A0ABW4YK43_9BACL
MYKGEQPSPWQSWANQVQLKIGEMEQTINTLQQQLITMEERLNQAENKPQYTIENIEYRFDQLKVEQLDGTLNIGMTSPFTPTEQAPMIDQIVLPKKLNTAPPHANSKKQESRTIGAIDERVQHYWQQESPRIIQGLEQHYKIALDPHHRQLLTKDIAQQLEGRTRYYMETISAKQPNDSSEQHLHEQVLQKTIDDSKQALMRYFEQIAGNN